MNAVVRTDNMFATDNRSGLVSVRYQPSETPTAIDNGNIVKLGALEAGSREVFVGETPAAETPLKDLVLIASPEVMYDETKRNLSDYTNEANKICRGYRFHVGDAFGVTKEALAGAAEPKVGDFAEAMAGTKINIKADSATPSATVIGKIESIEVSGRYKFYVIRVGAQA